MVLIILTVKLLKDIRTITAASPCRSFQYPGGGSLNGWIFNHVRLGVVHSIHLHEKLRKFILHPPDFMSILALMIFLSSNLKNYHGNTPANFSNATIQENTKRKGKMQITEPSVVYTKAVHQTRNSALHHYYLEQQGATYNMKH